LGFIYPRAIAYPLGVFAAWLAVATLCRGFVLYRHRPHTVSGRPTTDVDRLSAVEQHPRPERK
jgi:hypothetical protein